MGNEPSTWRKYASEPVGRCIGPHITVTSQLPQAEAGPAICRGNLETEREEINC